MSNPSQTTKKALGRESSQRGASMVECALLIAMISLVSYAAVRNSGNEIHKPLDSTTQAMANYNVCDPTDPNWPDNC